jgi:hypothetical protein
MAYVEVIKAMTLCCLVVGGTINLVRTLEMHLNCDILQYETV